MQEGTNSYDEKILSFLRNHAPYSVLDRGIQLVQAGAVVECSRSGSTITGTLHDEDETTHSLTLRIISSREVEASCSCSSTEDMAEQWCHHAIAMLLRAHELEFFESSGGFANTESTYRIHSLSPSQIARVMQKVSEPGAKPEVETTTTSEIAIYLDLQSDRLGVQIRFGTQVHGPSFFSDFKLRSSRALDNVLAQLLEDEGAWDESAQIWYVNSSASIEIILGLIREYDTVLSIQSGKKVSFSDSLLNARIEVEWQESSVELLMLWILPDGSEEIKEGELLGTGPYWAVVHDTVYRVSPPGSRIATAFPYSATISLSKAQSGPILEQIEHGALDPEYIRVKAEELQPRGELRDPSPQLEFERIDSGQDRESSDEVFCLRCSVDFQYPDPPQDGSLVYLPNREQELECIELLRSSGLHPLEKELSFEAKGDDALEIVYRGRKLFPKNWSVRGLEVLSRAVRFAELGVTVAVSGMKDPEKKSGTIDWFDCKISLTQNNANVPLSSLFKNVRPDQDRWVQLDSGAYARVPGGGLQKLRAALGMLDSNYRLSNSIKSKLSPAQALSLRQLEGDGVSLSSDRALKELLKKAENFSKITPLKATKNFEGELRKYQEQGLGWLSFLNEFNFAGILADEMGLGKTVQTLALLQRLKDSRSKDKRLNAPALVVAPTSVIRNWLYEAQRFAPRLKPLLLHGPTRKQHFQDLHNYDLVVTSYALLRNDRWELQQTDFSYVILDEAQNIKNHRAATTKAAKSLRTQHKLALTGTPTENRPMELWSIMDFLMPGYLGSAEYFRSHVEKPILEGGAGADVARMLQLRTRPFVLRRKKADVEKQLPPKMETDLHVGMTSSQAQLYAQILEEVRPQIFDEVEARGVGGASISILAALLRLRQVCNHPNSIASLRELSGFDSGKFNLLKEITKEAIENGRKILLFSQFRGMLALIRSWLEEEKIEHLYLDGATRNRQDLVDRYNIDETVRLFLISLKAGGTGINLTAADTVIIYDPWWNPAVEAQAVDRAHRIGQSKTVHVYRLVTEDSIEQKIMDLKQRKSELLDVLINESGVSALNLTREDLENLLAMPEERVTESED